MKKIVIIVLILLFVSIAGCSNYTGTTCDNQCNRVDKVPHNPICPPCPDTISPANETLVLSKELTSSDVPRAFPQDWGMVTYNLGGGGKYHIIVKTTGTDDAAIVQIGYQQKSNVDKFGNIDYNPVKNYIGSVDRFSDLDLKTTLPQDSIEQTIILVVQGQNGIISLNVYKVV